MTIFEVTARPFGPRFRGGGERYPSELAQELSRRETVIFASFPGRQGTQLPGVTNIALRGWSLSAPPLLSELNPIPSPRALLQIKEALQAHSSDLEFLHLHNLRTASTASWLAMARTRSPRSHFRIVLTDHGARFMPLASRWARGVDFYAAVSKFSLRLLQAWAPRPGVVVPVFVSNSLLRLSEEMQGKARDIDLLYLGRLLPWKRADLVLDLIPQLEVILGRALRVVVAGAPSDPAFVERLRSLVGRRTSRSRVEIILNPDDQVVADLYARTRLFVLLSMSGGYEGGRVPVPELAPFTPIEAAAFGTPSVVSAIPGLDEQVRGDQTGLLVDPSRLDEVAHAVATVLSDEPRWRELSSNARRFVQTERTVNVVSRLLEAYLDSVRRGAA